MITELAAFAAIVPEQLWPPVQLIVHESLALQVIALSQESWAQVSVQLDPAHVIT